MAKMRYFLKSFVLLFLMSLCLVSCSGGDDMSGQDVETVKLLISVPASAPDTRIGDPGTAVDEGEDWDRLAVMIAYTDKSRVHSEIITKDEFNALPDYEGYAGVKLFTIEAQMGMAYIYGVTYSSGVSGNPENDINACRTYDDVQALAIPNSYATDDADATAKFLSVATGYYKTAESGSQPAAFYIRIGGTGELGSIPTMTLTRLATKIDIQWDAADAYTQGYTDVKVIGFSFKGTEYGRLFPDIAPSAYTANPAAFNFYNTSEISQRNGRVYHYTFTDGVTTPSVTFNISAKQDGGDAQGKDYTLNFPSALQKAAWYKVNATIKGVTGSGNITLGNGTQLGD